MSRSNWDIIEEVLYFEEVNELIDATCEWCGTDPDSAIALFEDTDWIR